MRRSFPKHVLLPQEHGAWMMFLAPLVIGLVVGGRWSVDAVLLVVGALAAFFARQPLTILVKIRVGRRSKRDLPAALGGTLVYSGLALIALLWLVVRGYDFLLYLAVPGALVLGWYLSLVAQRSERHQMTLDLVAAGIMSLAAPAAVWVGQGRYVSEAWWLWFLLWLQAAASIVYIFVRLEQREWSQIPPLAQRWRHGWRALLYGFMNLILVVVAGWQGWLPPLLWLAYAVQAGEIFWGTLVAPAVGHRPTRIGLRQLFVYFLFSVLFLVAWLQA